MPTGEGTLRVYEELAERYGQIKEPKHRDMFLALAADAALGQGKTSEAERLRKRLLEVSPHHLLTPYGSFAEALLSPDVQLYLADLKRQFPPDLAQRLLRALGGRGDVDSL